MITKNSKCSDRLIYVGPSIPGHKLVKYQIFIGGLPKHIPEVFENCREIQNLFVPIEKLAQAETEIRTKGKLLNKYYKKVMEVFLNGI